MSEPSESSNESWELFCSDGSGSFEPVRTFERLADAALAIIDIEHRQTLTLHTTISVGEGGQVDLALEYQGRRAAYLIKNS